MHLDDASAKPSPASQPTPGTAASVILIGDGTAQSSEPAAARDLYISPLFTGRRAQAEASGLPWFVVSGRWGLLAPDDILAPYTFSFGRQSVNYRRAWGRFVAEQLCLLTAVGRNDVVQINASAAYTTALVAPIQYLGARVLHAAPGATAPGDDPR